MKNLVYTLILLMLSSVGFGQNDLYIEGKVINEQTGEPIAFSSLEVSINDSTFDAYTDENGRYRIWGLKEGSLMILASKTGFKEVEFEMNLTSESKEIYLDDIYLKPSIELEW